MLAVRTSGPNGTTRSCMDPSQLCRSSSCKKVGVNMENLSLFPNGPAYAEIFVNDSAIMNQANDHRTSVKIITRMLRCRAIVMFSF